ncbi:MAG: outer membrane protein assembly factor BamA [Gallionellaceae bacterium]|nr:MAG: outer membrane protein assembly factor BamA [Gallionellaceae bacterium]
MDFKKLAGLIPLLYAASVWAIEPFVIKDIRVEGIQRTEAGTVFSYLPVKVGDTLNDDQASAAIRALFSTGFFKDVSLKAEQGMLVVLVRERPSIASVEINGVKDFPKDQLRDNLKLVGLAEGRIFDKSALEKAEQELKRQYVARGKYGVSVKTTLTELERNRVAVSFNVVEGEVSKIRQINIVGNSAYSEEELLDMIKLSTPGMWSWMSKNDQYSKQKLSADMETIRTFYLDSGYMEFAIESTQVSISPDKKNIFITLNISEGPKYTISSVKVAGQQTVFPHDEIRKLIGLKSGDVFSRKAITLSTQKISERFGDEGYAFANVNAVPELDKEKHQVGFTFMVDPSQRVYIRRINVSGNTKTRDEVIRREFRQMESGWFATEKIKKSKQRVDRLGFFSSVNVETVPIQGSKDQMDLNVAVEEKSTGNLSIGAGISSNEGLTFMGGVSQSNLFGTGNTLSAQINTSKVNQIYSVSYTNPYYTDDGVSRGFDIYKRRTNATQLAVSQYTSDNLGGGVRFAVPLNEDETIHYGLAAEQTTIGLTALSPARFTDYINTFGATTENYIGTIGWSRDNRDSAIYTTEGTVQRAFTEASLPVSSQHYVKLTYQHQWFYPLSRDVTFMVNGETGVAKGYSGQILPFFKNFYAGGVGSVRGYEPSSLGPRDSNNYSLGGTKRVIGNAELLFPMPGFIKEKSVRLSVFLDGGAVFGDPTQVPASIGLRYSTGVALTWFSPVGPLKLSYGVPIGEQPQDKLQRIQFTLGTLF